MKEHIASAGNTEVPAYLAIQSKGYRVWSKKNTADADSEYCYAENSEICFIAENMLLLLGLIAMRELRGVDWKASDEEIDAFLKEHCEK